MRPGKPLMFGTLPGMTMIGLPGNPVSSLVCSLIFVQPLIRAMLGDPAAGSDLAVAAIAGSDLAANDERQEYMRARITGWRDGLPVATPAPRQDSSMLSTLADADALLIRPPHAPALAAGAPCTIIPLDRLDG